MISDNADTHSSQLHYFSRVEVLQPFGTFSDHPFPLEEKIWPSVEHYFQAMQCEDELFQEKVRAAESPEIARKMGKKWFLKRRKDWKTVRSIYMTRAVYSKCKAYPEIAEALLATGMDRLVENSQYDYYWGCGRDRRGENMYGQVLMNVRDKLREELKNQ
jgi:ribA/ribD-fused uncharacterized protein